MQDGFVGPDDPSQGAAERRRGQPAASRSAEGAAAGNRSSAPGAAWESKRAVWGLATLATREELRGRRKGTLECSAMEEDAAGPIGSASRCAESAAEEAQGAATAAAATCGSAPASGARAPLAPASGARAPLAQASGARAPPVQASGAGAPTAPGWRSSQSNSRFARRPSSERFCRRNHEVRG